MTSLANGFALTTLSILACGYIIYGAPICRYWWRKPIGYALYFHIIVVGLALVLPLTILLYTLTLSDFTQLNSEYAPVLKPEYAPVLAFFLAVVFRILAKISVWLYGKKNLDWWYRLELKNINEKGLAQIVFEKMRNGEMLMVTLENNKVYTGWPIRAPNNEDDKWLRLVPQWSGYRDDQFTINVTTDYSKVYDPTPTEREHMLIPVGKIITVQPFEEKVFDGFNR